MLTNRLHITAVLVMSACQMLQASSQQCGNEYSIYGKMLQRHIFKKIKASLGTECVQACNHDDRCQSFNYIISQEVCEFSNRTKEARPEYFVPDSDRYYYGLVRKRGIFFFSVFFFFFFFCNNRVKGAVPPYFQRLCCTQTCLKID